MANNGKKFAIGAAVGAALGYVAGILTAPKSGKETREDIKQTGKLAAKKAEQQLRRAHADITKVVNAAEMHISKAGSKVKKEADEALNSAKKSRDQLATLLSAVRSGNSEDEDLDLAVKNAKSAISAVKKYFKK